MHIEFVAALPCEIYG